MSSSTLSIVTFTSSTVPLAYSIGIVAYAGTATKRLRTIIAVKTIDINFFILTSCKVNLIY